jgi:hypothetical protein
MMQSVRSAWKGNRHWVAAGFLASTSLFLLLLFIQQRNEFRGIATSRATGLSAVAGDFSPPWWQKSKLPVYRRRPQARLEMAHLGGVRGGLARAPVEEGQPTPADSTDEDDTGRQVIRSGTLEITSTDPSQAAELLHSLAVSLSGFVVSSRVSGSDEQTRSAQVTIRIPAERFDEARARVRTIAKTVDQDTTEAQDVTREYMDKSAELRNARAEEAQYREILKRATTTKDVLEVSSKLAEVRGRIDQREADLRYLQHQVEMSLLKINITAIAEARVFGIRWQPLYKAKLSLRGALSAIADYGDSMVELLVNLPVIAMWSITVMAVLKCGWILLRRGVLLFFPELGRWLRRRAQSQLA